LFMGLYWRRNGGARYRSTRRMAYGLSKSVCAIDRHRRAEPTTGQA
jgi:hypothetical protein